VVTLEEEAAMSAAVVVLNPAAALRMEVRYPTVAAAVPNQGVLHTIPHHLTMRHLRINRLATAAAAVDLVIFLIQVEEANPNMTMGLVQVEAVTIGAILLEQEGVRYQKAAIESLLEVP
jgi:hypothetical protein